MTGNVGDVKIVELHIYHTEFSTEPLHRTIVVTRNPQILLREVKRALAMISMEDALSESKVAAIVRNAIRRSNSVELKTTKVKLVISKL